VFHALGHVLVALSNGTREERTWAHRDAQTASEASDGNVATRDELSRQPYISSFIRRTDGEKREKGDRAPLPFWASDVLERMTNPSFSIMRSTGHPRCNGNRYTPISTRPHHTPA
jgi:hypothetical protein